MKKILLALLCYALVSAGFVFAEDEAPASIGSLTFVRDDVPVTLGTEVFTAVTLDLLSLLKITSAEKDLSSEGWEQEKRESYLLLRYDEPRSLAVKEDKEIIATDLLLPLEEKAALLVYNADTDEYRSFSGYSERAWADLVCRPELELEVFEPFCETFDLEKRFVSEHAAQGMITESCKGLASASPEHLRCVESVLHSLWEEKKVLYTAYDRVLKKAWESVYCPGSSCSAERRRTHQQKNAVHTLFNMFLEQTKLERKIQMVHTDYMRAQFAAVSRALKEEKAPPRGRHDEHLAELKVLQAILSDLLKAHPELPPSPYLNAPYSVESITARPSDFKHVDGAISAESSGKDGSEVKEKKNLRAHSEKEKPSAASSRLENREEPETVERFLADERTERRNIISYQKRIQELRKEINELTMKALRDDLTTDERQRLNSLQEELVRAAREFASGTAQEEGRRRGAASSGP